MARSLTKDELINMDAISFGRLKALYDSPALYHGRYVTREIPYDPVTPEMKAGKAIEAYLRGDMEAPQVIPAEVLSSNGSRAGNAYKAWKEATPGADDYMTPAEYARLVEPLAKIKANVEAHPVARDLLYGQDCRWSQAVAWEHSSGLQCKAEADVVQLVGGGITEGTIVNIKTVPKGSANPEAFSRTVVNARYDVQAAHETEGMLSLGTIDLCMGYVFVLIEREAPYSVETFELDAHWREYAVDLHNQLLADLRVRHETNVWTSPTWGMVARLSLPRWA